jgi:hypothetical protein
MRQAAVVAAVTVLAGFGSSGGTGHLFAGGARVIAVDQLVAMDAGMCQIAPPGMNRSLYLEQQALARLNEPPARDEGLAARGPVRAVGDPYANFAGVAIDWPTTNSSCRTRITFASWSTTAPPTRPPPRR